MGRDVRDDEDFYETGYQPGDEIELFAADEAGQLAKKRLALLELAAAKAAPPEDYSLASPVRLSVLSYSLTPPSSPSPAPPEDSPTADERAAALQLPNFLRIAASDQTVVGECWPVRDRLVPGHRVRDVGVVWQPRGSASSFVVLQVVKRDGMLHNPLVGRVCLTLGLAVG